MNRLLRLLLGEWPLFVAHLSDDLQFDDAAKEISGICRLLHRLTERSESNVI